jgi:hypothetical protein
MLARGGMQVHLDHGALDSISGEGSDHSGEWFEAQDAGIADRVADMWVTSNRS